MVRCNYPGCGWQSLAPSEAAAREQFADHLVTAHAERVDAEIPEGMVQIRVDDSGWREMTPEQASAFHDAVFADESADCE